MPVFAAPLITHSRRSAGRPLRVTIVLKSCTLNVYVPGSHWSPPVKRSSWTLELSGSWGSTTTRRSSAKRAAPSSELKTPSRAFVRPVCKARRCSESVTLEIHASQCRCFSIVVREHASQTSCPQVLQWCFQQNVSNAAAQMRHVVLFSFFSHALSFSVNKPSVRGPEVTEPTVVAGLIALPPVGLAPAGACDVCIRKFKRTYC